jgi:phosphotransferase system HPr (HPr) family protein
MMPADEHSADVAIDNPMGFHVRPVQRFAELARMFKCDVKVRLRKRTVPGKSVINLVSLGGRCGDSLHIVAAGQDARQCLCVLTFLARKQFFVEDTLDTAKEPLRHVERLARMASCFESDIQAIVGGRRADAKDMAALKGLGLAPTSAVQFEIAGRDAEQALAVLSNLVASCFYVEDSMAQKSRGAT